MREYDALRAEKAAQMRQRREAVYRRLPRVKEIEDALAMLGIQTAKLVLVITLIFTAIEALIAILSGIASLNVNMGTALNWISFFVLLAKIGIFAAGIIMTLCDVSLTSSRTEQKKETKAETSNASAAQSEPASAESSAAESNESEKTE